MRIHEPHFPEDVALFIVWVSDAFGRRSALATSDIAAARAAWPVLVAQYAGREMTLQHGARVIARAGPEQNAPGT